MNLQIKDNQYLPNGLGKPASTYYYIVDVDSTKKSKYLSKKTGKFITSTAFDIKYDGFYNEEQAESFLKKYLKTNAPTQESRINEYGRKPKIGVQNNYPKEIAQKTGTREDEVRLWLRQMEVDPLTILQGIGSGRIERNDFLAALRSDNGTLEFLKKYNSDGKWSSVWKGTAKTESKYPTINLVKRMIKEEWVSFGSHRTHEKAERILGQLPTAKTSFRHEGQYYELDSEQISKIKNLKSVKIRTKLPGNESDWVNVWK